LLARAYVRSGAERPEQYASCSCALFLDLPHEAWFMSELIAGQSPFFLARNRNKKSVGQRPSPDHERQNHGGAELR